MVNLQSVQFYPLDRVYSIFRYPEHSTSSTILPIGQSVQYIQLPWSIYNRYNFTHQVECTVYSATLSILQAVQFFHWIECTVYSDTPAIYNQYNFTHQVECTVYSATLVNLPAVQFYPLDRVYSIFSYPGQSASSTILPIGQSVQYIQLHWSICQQYNFTHQVECTVYLATLSILQAVQFYPLDRVYSIFSYPEHSTSSTIFPLDRVNSIFRYPGNLQVVQFYPLG